MTAWPAEVPLAVTGGPPRGPDLDRLVRAVARQHGSSDLRVATILAWKRYAYTVAAPVMAAWGRHGIAVDLGLDNAVVEVDDDEPLLRVAAARARWHEPATLAAALGSLRGGHLDTVRTELGARAGVGRRTFAVLETATLVSALAATAPPDRAFAAVSELLAVLGVPGLVEVAELTPAGGRPRPLALRTACCLAYQVQPGRYCASCNLIDDDQRTAQLAEHGMSWRRCG